MPFTLSEVLTLVLPTLAVIFVITAIVYAGSSRQSKRYRPGRPFEFTPVWFLSSPQQLAGNGGAAQLPRGPRRGEITGRPTDEPNEGPLLAAQTEGTHDVGGASDRW